MRNIIIGALVLAAGLLADSQLKNMGGDILYYAVLVLGVIFLACGIRSYMKSDDADISDDDLVKKVMLETLARMSYADTNTHAVEVEAVRRVYKHETGIDITDADVRVAARSDLREIKPFKTYLGNVQGRLDKTAKCSIMRALADVVKADAVVSASEVEFFNEIGVALKLNPADLTDLVAGMQSGPSD